MVRQEEVSPSPKLLGLLLAWLFTLNSYKSRLCIPTLPVLGRLMAGEGIGPRTLGPPETLSIVPRALWPHKFTFVRQNQSQKANFVWEAWRHVLRAGAEGHDSSAGSGFTYGFEIKHLFTRTIKKHTKPIILGKRYAK